MTEHRTVPLDLMAGPLEAHFILRVVVDFAAEEGIFDGDLIVLVRYSHPAVISSKKSWIERLVELMALTRGGAGGRTARRINTYRESSASPTDP